MVVPRRDRQRGGSTINKIHIRKKVIFIIVAIVLLVSIISFRISAIIVTPDITYTIENETYTVNQTMNFESITIDSSYIIFNDTGFYVTSGNDITITLVYINDDITSAVDGEKVLEFYADTSGGIVWFNLSGFPALNNYTVNRSGSSISTPTANGSGFISFTNNVWSSQLFEIIQEGEGTLNNPPVVSNIPDQTILMGASFTQIDLDNYVFDVEDPDEDIDWSYSGNTELLVSIVNRVATISTPNSNWYGVETIEFTAKDTGGLTDSDNATFMVIANNAPFFSDLSISNGATKVPISTSSLCITIEDPNGDLIDWTIETSPDIGNNSENNGSNGSKLCGISGLAYSTKYYWFVNATDGIYWTNISYSFTTEAAPSNNPPPPRDSGEEDTIPEENNSPYKPVKPSGPTYVEMGVEYLFTTLAADPDGDDIRYRFDWGDGNMSNWAAFVPSNTSVSMSHSWTFISTFEVRVIAQDENGLNSSWSLPLNVTVSQFDLEGEPPVADFVVPSNLSTNQTIVFDASGSFDEDGVIVSYFWDFGDGLNGTGINLSHVYETSGEYTVTLVVTDNEGNSYSKSIVITVVSEGKKEKLGENQGLLLFDLGIILTVFAMIILACLAVFFREDIKSFVLSYIHYIHMFSHWKIWDTRDRIEKIDDKIEKIKQKMALKEDLTQPFIGKNYSYSDIIPERHDRIARLIDSRTASTSEEKVDKLIKMNLSHDKHPGETRDTEMFKDLDFRSKIDMLHLLNERKNPNFAIDTDRLSYESSKDSVERMVDHIFISRLIGEIDNLKRNK